MYRVLFSARTFSRLLMARLRAHAYRLCGARIAKKCLFFERVRIDRPWRISIGHRTQLESDVWLKIVADQAIVAIGDYTFVGRGTEIDVSLGVTIGSHVLIAPGVFITDHGHKIAADALIDAQGCAETPISIEDDVWLGARCVILPGVRVGRGAVVGAGAVVTRDVTAFSVVSGVPARVMRRRT